MYSLRQAKTTVDFAQLIYLFLLLLFYLHFPQAFVK